MLLVRSRLLSQTLYPGHSFHLLDSFASDRARAWVCCVCRLLTAAVIVVLCFYMVLPILKQFARKDADVVAIISSHSLLLGPKLAQVARHGIIFAQYVHCDVVGGYALV